MHHLVDLDLLLHTNGNDFHSHLFTKQMLDKIFKITAMQSATLQSILFLTHSVYNNGAQKNDWGTVMCVTVLLTDNEILNIEHGK